MQITRLKVVVLILSLSFLIALSLSNNSVTFDEMISSPTTSPILERDFHLSENPQNVQAPVLHNPDDTDNMYALRNYQISVFVSDPAGYAEIYIVQLSLYDNARDTNIWTINYNEDTDAFTKFAAGGSYIYLQLGSCSTNKTGNNIFITFAFSLDWTHPDVADVDIEQWVIGNGDGTLPYDIDWYEVNWDIETRLDYSILPSITTDAGGGTVDRGDLNEAFEIAGSITYYGSSLTPDTDAVDVWVIASEYGSNIGPWRDQTLISGAFSVLCYADNAVGQDTYTIKVVRNHMDSGSSDLYYTTSETETYIADRINVQSYSVIDNRVNIGTNVSINVTLIYEYDDSQITDGTVTVNGVSASHQGSGIWQIVENETSVIDRSYDTVVCSDLTHGLSAVNQNSQSQTVIWDSLTISVVNPNQRINIGTNASGIIFTAIHDYDSSIYDGEFLLNDTTFLFSEAGRHGYTVFDVSGGSFGITAININDETFCIWDSLLISITDPFDQRINIGSNATGIVASAVYEFDGATYDGVLTLNSTNFLYGSVGRRGYTVQSAIGGLFPLVTVIGTNDMTWCIWDRLIIDIQSDTNTADSNQEVVFSLSVVFEYDGVTCTSYNLAIERNSTLWKSFSNSNLSSFIDLNSDVSYEYTTNNVTSESLYGITAYETNTVIVSWLAPDHSTTTTSTTTDTPTTNTETTTVEQPLSFETLVIIVSITIGSTVLIAVLVIIVKRR